MAISYCRNMKNWLRGEIVPQPKVSVIVPVYNAEKYLERCIRSLTNQTLKEIEILLVDDDSTDGSLRICQQAAQEDPRIQVIHKVNEGAGKARNAALPLATGEYIGFVDSDDFVEPDMFRTLCEKAESYRAELVMSGVLYVGGTMFEKEGDRICKRYFEEDTLFTDKDDLCRLQWGIVGARPEDTDDSQYGMSIWKNLFVNDIIQKNGLTFQSEREMLSEDALFMIDYIACIGTAVGIPQAFYNYCRNEESISKSYKKNRFEKSLVFVHQVESRFQRNGHPEEYSVYIHRFWQAMCRVLCAQEILHAARNRLSYADLKHRLRAICTHEQTIQTLNEYPLGTLPLKQRVFAYAMKYRAYGVLKLLVGLRSN